MINTIIVCFLTFSAIPSTVQEHAGVKVIFSQKGLNYAADVAMDMLIKKLSDKALDDIQGKDGDLSYAITNIKIHELSKPKFDASFNEKDQQMIWSINNAKISASANFKFVWKKNRFLRIKDSGKMTMAVQDLSLNVGWSMKFNPATGIPLVQANNCQSKVGNIDIDFSGKTSFIYKMLFKLLKSPLDGKIEGAMCKAVQSSLNEDANNDLKNLQVNIDLNKDLKFSFKMVALPYISSSYITFVHSGCSYLSGHEQCPNNHSPMNEGPQDRMLSVSISNSVFDNLADGAFAQGIMKTTVTSNDNTEQSKDFFDTNCKSGLCMASFFRKIANKYPNSKFEIDFAVLSPPSLDIKKNEIKTNVKAAAVVFIRENSEKRTELFTTSIDTELDLSARIADGNVLKSEIITFKPKISLFNITTEYTSSKKIEVLGKMLGKVIVKKANKAADEGLPLLSIKNLMWHNADISIKDGYLHLMTDLLYSQ